MHLFHPVSGIKKYNTAEEILIDFAEVRVKYYKLRKKHILNKLSEQEIEVSNKARFVKMVTEDEMIIFKRKKIEIENELEHLKFEKVNEKYDYLLNIKTYQYTEEEIEKLNNEHIEIRNEIQTLKGTPILDMWKTDILKC
jgi:DNA topoisomerase-2